MLPASAMLYETKTIMRMRQITVLTQDYGSNSLKILKRFSEDSEKNTLNK